MTKEDEEEEVEEEEEEEEDQKEEEGKRGTPDRTTLHTNRFVTNSR